MTYDYDVAIIGTGTSAYMAAYPCTRAGLRVAMIDERPYGGTCAMRGCQPKKYLVAAASARERVSAMQTIGLSQKTAIDWPALVRAKNAFTDPVPERTAKGFRETGMATLHGHARFISDHELDIDGQRIAARHIVIATGAIPRSLGIPGENLLTHSDQFMELPALPVEILFIGGGYISFEFAHVAHQAGSRVTILQKGEQVLTQFDPDITAELVAATRAGGIRIHLNSCVDNIEQSGERLRVWCEENPEQPYEADIVVHGAGRTAALQGLDPAAAGIDHDPTGIQVNAHMQSVSNPFVYAIGDAAATPYKLATTADMEGEVAGRNIIDGNHHQVDYSVVPSAVFSLPPLARVGLSAAEAEAAGYAYEVKTGEMTGWPSSRRIGQRHARYKVIIDPHTKCLLGADLLGHRADETINVLALAIRFGITTNQLKQMLWAYPTYTSDLKYMI